MFLRKQLLEAESDTLVSTIDSTSPVYPGETLVTDIWCDGEVVSFRTRVAERDVVVLGNGRAVVRCRAPG